MKRKLVALLVGVVASAASIAESNAQGYIMLDNYASSGQIITYGAGSNGTVGTGVNGYTVGLYYALGSQTFSDGTGIAVPGAPFTLGAGNGSTTPLTSGYFSATDPFGVPGSSAGGTVSIIVVAYSGADYASSQYRGHSAAITMTALANTANPPAAIGTAVPGPGVMFSVLPVPEPSTFALAGLGAAALLIFRRKK